METQLMRRILAVLAVALSLAVLGCGGGASPSPTPRVAPSVAVGEFPAALNPRVIEVFVMPGTAEAELRAMAARIAHMPQVERYTYVSHEEALKEFLAGDPSKLLQVGSNPFPGSFRILVRNAGKVETVAQRFFDDPIVDNSAPGERDGVSYRGHRQR